MTTSARIVADTMGEHGARITTFEVVMPRMILPEFNTHRVLAKSAASSRAIPVAKRIAMLKTDCFVPDQIGRNRPGMQATELLDENANEQARAIWIKTAEAAIAGAEAMAALNTHKQHANRILEPWSWVRVCVTATEWENFWWLRVSPDAQPEFEALAKLMREVYFAGQPVRANHHLPYIDDKTRALGLTITDLYHISAARCARVSYQTFEGKPSDLDDDLELCSKLVKSGHLSPFDHPAMADMVEISEEGAYWSDPDAHRQYWGWIPYRVDIEQQIGRRGRRNSHARLY
jgi:thymidylate synthase ThyX